MQIIILTLPGRHLFRKRNKNKGVTHEVSRSKYLLSFARTRPSQPKRLLRRSRLPRPLGRESSAFAKGLWRVAPSIMRMPRSSPSSAVALLRTPSAIAYGVGRGRASGEASLLTFFGIKFFLLPQSPPRQRTDVKLNLLTYCLKTDSNKPTHLGIL